MREVRSWPSALADNLGLRTSDLTVRFRNGLSFEVRGGTDDGHVLFEVLVKRVYPMAVSPGDLVIDIGAHIGAFTVVAAHAGARVLAFEACPDNAAVLRRNLHLNGMRQVRVFQLAVGGGRGERSLFIPDDPTWTGRRSLHPGRGRRTLTVPCIPLDDVVADAGSDRVDLVKIDCEGGEYEILLSAANETLARIRALVAECHQVPGAPAEWSPGGLSAHLQRNGFAVGVRGRILVARRGD